MSSIVIVTDHCYLSCENINHVRMEELHLTDERWTYNKKTLQVSDSAKHYQISIDFDPVVTNNTSHKQRNCSEVVKVIITGKKNAHSVYREIIHQIREQTPDKLYLDKLVDKFFTDR